MTYTKEYNTDDKHIDVQGIMDGLYYPFYLEYCRHDFIKEILGFDLEENAKNGINMVLSEYTIRFLRSLVKDDKFTVTCSVELDSENKPKLYFHQRIMRDGKVITDAVFTGTCVPSAGGKSFLPLDIIEKITEYNKVA